MNEHAVILCRMFLTSHNATFSILYDNNKYDLYEILNLDRNFDLSKYFAQLLLIEIVRKSITIICGRRTYMYMIKFCNYIC